MGKFWFADAASVPIFWENVHEPTGDGINRAVQAPEKGVKGVLAVELSTFSFPVDEEVEDARATPGMQASGLVDQLIESGVRLPKRVVADDPPAGPDRRDAPRRGLTRDTTSGNTSRVAAPGGCGAGDGNRTRVSSLGSWRSTIELHRRASADVQPTS